MEWSQQHGLACVPVNPEPMPSEWGSHRENSSHTEAQTVSHTLFPLKSTVDWSNITRAVYVWCDHGLLTEDSHTDARVMVLYTEGSRGTADQTEKCRGASPGTSFSLTSKLTSKAMQLFTDVECLDGDMYLCRSSAIICLGWHVSLAARTRPDTIKKKRRDAEH